ncbi:MAG: hypothetical protein ACRC2T_02380 [Thermoguttaceae bacterium]
MIKILKMKNTNIFILLLCVSLFYTTGCSNDPVPVQPVTGKIEYNGAPLEEALIVFTPKSSDARSATGMSDKDGNFTLATPGAKRKGAMIGDYIVTVSKTITVDAAGNPVETPKMTEAPTGPPVNFERPRTKSVIPEAYNDTQSPLLEETIKKGKNPINLKLVDQ